MEQGRISWSALFGNNSDTFPLFAPSSPECKCSNTTKGTAHSKAPGVRNLPLSNQAIDRFLFVDAGSCPHAYLPPKREIKKKGGRHRRSGPRRHAGPGRACPEEGEGQPEQAALFSDFAARLWRPRQLPPDQAFSPVLAAKKRSGFLGF